jgi:hypothetical protein
LSAGIFARQIAEVGTHHGASPFCTFLIESGWDSFAAGTCFDHIMMHDVFKATMTAN